MGTDSTRDKLSANRKCNVNECEKPAHAILNILNISLCTVK